MKSTHKSNDLLILPKGPLRENLFTQVLEANGIELEGGKDVRIPRKLKMGRLKELLDGLEDGSVRFVDKAMVLQR